MVFDGSKWTGWADCMAGVVICFGRAGATDLDRDRTWFPWIFSLDDAEMRVLPQTD